MRGPCHLFVKRCLQLARNLSGESRDSVGPRSDEAARLVVFRPAIHVLLSLPPDVEGDSGMIESVTEEMHGSN
jgi:hypothetical protein